MTRLQKLLTQRRLVFTVVAVLALAGAMSWLTMVRQEDPRLPEFWGQVVVGFPGAEAELVERLILEPIEEKLAEVSEISWTEATAYSEMAVLFIELRQDVDDPDEVWNDVREALTEARLQFPPNASEPRLNDEAGGDLESVVLAVTGSPDYLELLDAARTLEDGLLGLSQVAKVLFIADPGEQVTIELDDAVARRLGVTPTVIRSMLAARSQILPGGSLQLGDRTIRLRPLSEFESVDDIAATPISLPSGGSVPLSEIARVHLGPREPATALMRHDGEMAVGLGIIAKKDINLVSFGATVRERIAELSESLAPIEVQEMAFQPTRVESRLEELGESLLLGILIVAGVVIIAMGLRLGLVVASVVPLVAMASLGVFAFSGGVLHQISIAALVLALGMLVDNAIVVAENVQWRLDRGVAHREAAVAAVRELAVPLGASTATTIAAFVPMLLAQGPTAEFTRSIPIIIMLTLLISYLFALLFTPMLSQMSLKPGGSRAVAFTDRLGRRLAKIATNRPTVVVVGAVMLVAFSVLASGLVQRQFFPSSDRNQLVVDIRLPEGAHLEATNEVTRALEQELLSQPKTTHVTSFVGRSAPKFYYNLPRVPWSPHFAQVVVGTRTADDVPAVVAWVRDFAGDELPGIEVVPKKLEQGPPVDAPVEVRLLGHDLPDLYEAAKMVSEQLRSVPGAIDVRHDLGPGEPTMVVAVNDAAAARFGVMREHVAWTLYGHSRGLPAGELYSEEDPVPILVRAAEGERLPAEQLGSIHVASSHGKTVPLAQVARIDSDWRPAAINHRNRQRIVTVSSQLAPGFAYSNVLSVLRPKLDELELPHGVIIAFGGEAEGSEEANAALMSALPIGALLLIGVLLAEFNSFRKVGIVLATVPLAAAGVVPGLLLFHQPFGFMSFLGVIALVGIVVNNAIVLLEVVERQRRRGAEIDEALTEGVLQRIRPILLTTATTVCGLLPLAFSSSTLWPPLASAMISGLIASTLLTLVVVPALYRLLLGGARRTAPALNPTTARVAAGIALILLSALSGNAQDPRNLTLAETMRLAGRRPAAEAQRQIAEAVAQAGSAERRSSYLPVVGVEASASDRNKELELMTPIGSFPFGSGRANTVGAMLVQPVFDASRQLWANPATRLESERATLESERAVETFSALAAETHLELLALQARREATVAFTDSLSERLAEVEGLVTAGRSLESDALKIRLALEQAEHDLLALDQQTEVVELQLAHAVGLNGEVVALGAPDWTNRIPPDKDRAVQLAFESRADIHGVDAGIRALELRRKALKAEALPRLDARLTWTWGDGLPYTTDRWIEGAIVMSWTPFEAGTRAPRVAVLQAQHRARINELEETRRRARLEVRSALAEIRTARGAVDVGERGLQQAAEALRVERERHGAGRSTTYDLLEAEAQLRAKKTQRELARLAVNRAWVRLWLATGNDSVLPIG